MSLPNAFVLSLLRRSMLLMACPITFESLLWCACLHPTISRGQSSRKRPPAQEPFLKRVLLTFLRTCRWVDLWEDVHSHRRPLLVSCQREGKNRVKVGWKSRSIMSLGYKATGVWYLCIVRDRYMWMMTQLVLESESNVTDKYSVAIRLFPIVSFSRW